jgi:hypothetical protein
MSGRKVVNSFPLSDLTTQRVLPDLVGVASTSAT